MDTNGQYERWTARAGAWLGIGTSPAALVLGAGLADQHRTAPAVAGVAVGAVLMAMLLFANGVGGLPSRGADGLSLTEMMQELLDRRDRIALNALLVVAMIGWFGFSIGVGGAALNSVLQAPRPVGQLALAAPVVGLSMGGIRRWNAAAVFATVCTLVLVGAIATQLVEPQSPVKFSAWQSGMTRDVAAFLGYAGVFSLRTPDFTLGLGRRRDLWACIALLVGSTVAVALVGVGLDLSTHHADVISALARSDVRVLGGVLLAVSVVAGCMTQLHSGALSARALVAGPHWAGVFVVAVPGAALGIARFDRRLVEWLAYLAAILPPLIVPLAVEGLARRRGVELCPVTPWRWMPGSALGIALTIAGAPGAAMAGLAVTSAFAAPRVTQIFRRTSTPHPEGRRPGTH